MKRLLSEKHKLVKYQLLIISTPLSLVARDIDVNM